ncbi:MAG TPA: hypothetical protein VI542_06105 [Candidatus Tectomicrobia bacterium]
MNLTDFYAGQRVFYCNRTYHHTTPQKITYEPGTVSSTNDTYVFVKFDAQVVRMGWQGTTAQACHPGDLSTTLAS